MEYKSEFQQKRLVSLVIWAALSGSMFLYALITFILKGDGERTIVITPQLSQIFLGIAGIAGAFSIWIYKTSVSPEKLLARMKKLGPLPSTPDGEAFDQAVLKIADRWISIHIACWALNEGIVLTGFVPAFMSRNPVSILPYLVAGAALNLWMRPNLFGLRDRLKTLIEAESVRSS